jgi:hypothetical protein
MIIKNANKYYIRMDYTTTSPMKELELELEEKIRVL